MAIDPSQLVDKCIETGVHPVGMDPPTALKELHVDNLRSGSVLKRVALDEAPHDVRFCEQGDAGKRCRDADPLLEARISHTARGPLRPAT